MYKSLFLLLAVMISGCTWLETLPGTQGIKMQPVNNDAPSEYARLHADLLDIQNTLEKQGYKTASIKLKPDHSSSRVVYLYFANTSTVFKPTPAEEMDLLPYIKKTKHIEIRSRSDYFHSDAASEKISLERACSIKRYLLSRGVLPSIISMHYAVNDDSMEAEEGNVLYGKNSPVAVELFYE